MHRLAKGLHLERNNGAIANAGKVIMNIAKGGCLAVLLASRMARPGHWLMFKVKNTKASVEKYSRKHAAPHGP